MQQTAIDLPPDATAHDTITDASAGTQHLLVQQYTSGPLPPAAELAAYRDIDPELPNRIVAMAEKAQTHAHEQDRENIALAQREQRLFGEQHDRQSEQIRRGQWFAFLSVIWITGIGPPVAAFVNLWIGSAISGAGLVMLLAMIVNAFLQSGWGKPDRADTADSRADPSRHASPGEGDNAE